jgi:hypothetical protein
MAKKKSMKNCLVSNNHLFDVLMKMGCSCTYDENGKISLRWIGGCNSTDDIKVFRFLSLSLNLGWYDFEFFVPNVIA